MNNKENFLPVKISIKKNISKLSDLFYKSEKLKNSIRILQYHNISDRYIPYEWGQMTTPKKLFNEQMRYLRDYNYNVISAEEVLDVLASDKNIPPKTVCITFDDGFSDNYINAFPILEKYGLKATLFITAKFIDGKPNLFGEYLTWSQIREMGRSGVFNFGSHSLSHKNMAGLNNDELTREIRESRKILEEMLGVKINTFAYPFGWHNSFDKKAFDVLEKEGFRCAFTGIYGANTKKTNRYSLRRISISWFDEHSEFQKILRGSYDWYSIYQKMSSIWKKPL